MIAPITAEDIVEFAGDAVFWADVDARLMTQLEEDGVFAG